MKFKCKCGYLISDNMVPNKVRLWINNIKTTKEHYDIFLCECCNRIHFISSSGKYFVAGIPVEKSIICKHYTTLDSLFLQDDIEEDFEVRYCDICKKMYMIFCDGKITVYAIESISDITDGKNTTIYSTNIQIKNGNEHSEKIKNGVLTSTGIKLRCSCGWLINECFTSFDNILNIYSESSWNQNIKCIYGEIDYFQPLKAFICEKCGKLLIPDKEYNYYIYSASPKEINNFLPCFEIYFIKKSEELFIDYDECSNAENVLHKMMGSDDGKIIKLMYNDKSKFFKA